MSGVIFTVDNAVTNVFFKSCDVFEVVEGLVVKEGLVQWPFLIKEIIPLVLPVVPVELVCFLPLFNF